MDINLRFESNSKNLEIGRGKPYRLLKLDGIETGKNELSITNNVFGDGGKVDNKKITAKPIMIEVEYKGKDKFNERRKLMSFFNIHNDGRLIVKIGNMEKAIDYDIESFNSKLENIHKPLKFLVSLYCPNPFFKDLSEHKSEIAIWQGTFEFPLEIVAEGIEMGYREPSLIVNIFNDGDVPCGMRIKFKAINSVKNPSLFNVNTREYFKINKTMMGGEVITVNTNFQRKRVETESNGTIKTLTNWDKSSTFLQLGVGDNLFRYDAEENVEGLEVDIYYQPQWLGV